MIPIPVSFDLPTPWSGKSFSATRFGALNYLVGPNGSVIGPHRVGRCEC